MLRRYLAQQLYRQHFNPKIKFTRHFNLLGIGAKHESYQFSSGANREMGVIDEAFYLCLRVPPFPVFLSLLYHFALLHCVSIQSNQIVCQIGFNSIIRPKVYHRISTSIRTLSFKISWNAI